MKRALYSLCAVFCAIGMQAQDAQLLNLKAEVRVDYQREHLDGSTYEPNTGFKGKYVNILMNGEITPQFSYSYRQRLNKAHKDQSFFDATDWAYITYKPDAHWSLSGGKQVVGIGGFEYDRAPINLYFCSEFWNNIPCYQLGASVAYSIGQGNDQLMAQVCQSPWRLSEADMYAYNLMWMGNHGRHSSLWSANLLEYLPGKYIFYLALGNQLQLGASTRLQVDLMNRAVSHHPMLLKDCSVMAELSHRCRKVNMFCKMTYDVNATGQEGDFCVTDGTEMKSVGAGIEFFPAKGTDDVRLHANAVYAWGKNGNVDGTMLPKQTRVDVGVTWRMNLLSFTNKK